MKIDSYLTLSLLLPTLFIILYVIFHIILYFILFLLSLSLVVYINAYLALSTPYQVVVAGGIGLVLLLAVVRIKKGRKRGIFLNMKRLNQKDGMNYGSKASMLGSMIKRGVLSPVGIAMPRRVFDGFIKYNRIEISPAAGENQRVIMAGNFSRVQSLILWRVLRKMRRLSKCLDRKLILRSSFVGEDSLEVSFAGQFESVDIESKLSDLKEGLKRCWASFWSGRAVIYRRDREMTGLLPRLSVILQERIEPDFWGVSTSINPVRGYAEELFIDIKSVGNYQLSGIGHQASGIGQKKSCVESGLNESTVCVNKITGSEEVISGTLPQDLDLRRLAAVMLGVEERFKSPVSIEWAVSGGEVYVLQVREVPIRKKVITYTNREVVEVFGEPLSRMSLSLIERERPLSEIPLLPFRHYASLPPAPSDLTRLIHSRMYVNYNFMKGLEAGLKLSFFQSLKFLMLIKNHQRFVRAFIDEMSCFFNEFKDKPADRMEATVIYHRIEILGRLINRKGIELQAAAFHIFHTLMTNLNTFIDRIAPDGDVLEGLSLYPDECSLINERMALESLAESVRQYGPELARFIEDKDVDKLKNFPDFHEEWIRYLGEYGHKGLEGDVELSTTKMAEDPRLLFRILRPIIDSPRALRESAGLTCDIKRRFSGKNIVKWDYFLFCLLLKYTRIYNGLREDIKHNLLKGNFLIKSLLLDLARRPPLSACLEEEGDIFFLDINHIMEPVQEDFIKEKVKRNKEIYNKDRDVSASPVYHFEDGGISPSDFGFRISDFGVSKSAFRIPHSALHMRDGLPVSSSNMDVIRGIPGCKGKVQGVAKILMKEKVPVKINRGEIIVVKAPNPLWCVYLGQAGGLVVEGGGSSSHLAITAREFKIPSIFGAHGATDIIKDGQTIAIDGEKGEVGLIK